MIQWSSPTGRGIFYWELREDGTIVTRKRITDEKIWATYDLDLQEMAWNFVATTRQGKGVKHNCLNMYLYNGNANYNCWASRLRKIMIQCGIWEKTADLIISNQKVENFERCKQKLQEYFDEPARQVPVAPS